MFKKTTYITLSNRRQSIRQDAFVSEQELEQPNIPEGLWEKCPKCGSILYKEDLEKNFHVCKACGHHERISARERIKQIADPGTFVEIDEVMPDKNPLNFPDYENKLKKCVRLQAYAKGLFTVSVKFLVKMLFWQSWMQVL